MQGIVQPKTYTIVVVKGKLYYYYKYQITKNLKSTV